MICEVRRPHPPRVLDHFHIFLSKLLGVQLQQPLGDLRQRSELGFFVNVLLAVFVLKESLRTGNKKNTQSEREYVFKMIENRYIKTIAKILGLRFLLRNQTEKCH